MSDLGGEDTQSPLSDNEEYAPDEQTLSPTAGRLLRPHRSFVGPVLVFAVFAAVASLVMIGISRLGQVEQPKPHAQNEAPPPLSEQPIEPTEPFKSLILDAAQSYLVTGTLSVVTAGPNAKRR
jgi:hypothetical protein